MIGVSDSILGKIDNQYFVSHFNIDVLQESYSATLDIGELEPNGENALEILRENGFEVIHENDTIYTIKKKI